MDQVIGIDLGTTDSRVAICRNGVFQVLPSIPSFIAFRGDLSEPLFGDEAKLQVSMNPLCTVFQINRLIGKRSLDFGVKQEMSLWPFRFYSPTLDENEEPVVDVQYDGKSKTFSAVAILSLFLRNLRKIALQDLSIGGEQDVVLDCVISVPSVFNDSQRRSVRNAAKQAGFNILRILNETSAAVIHYGVRKGVEQLDLNKSYEHHQQVEKRQKMDDEENILVFDLGGGSLSVAIIRVKEDDNVKKFQVKSQAGDSHLGGKDVDDRILLHCLNKFAEINKDVSPRTFTNLDRQQDGAKYLAMSLSRLRFECERAKTAFSSRGHGDEIIQVSSFHNTKNLVCTLSFDEFQNITKDLCTKCKMAIVQCITDANLKDPSSVDKVIALGRSTELPGIKNLLESMFSGIIKFPGTNAVVRGAATQASLLSGQDVINKVRRDSLMDVTSFDVSIELHLGGKQTLIRRNTKLPAQADYILGTTSEQQVISTFRVYEQGWDELDNFVGLFKVEDIPPGTYRTPNITAKFKIDQDGILDGTAMDAHHTPDICAGDPQPVPRPSSEPGAYNSTYPGYECSVMIYKGRFSSDDIEVLRQRNGAAM
ncbi:hypothetical protein MKW98_004184 [Papaver atlanticum]|uniref:Uncharacterized protein n=1 Tax=Papaver atlanticum TaxID=357466 RepID=A0AAD4T8X3_9MAGN|nr:hypothetical protein MKW98_004184 [Papaver atlanticum]